MVWTTQNSLNAPPKAMAQSRCGTLLKWALQQSIWTVLALWHKCLHKPATTMDSYLYHDMSWSSWISRKKLSFFYTTITLYASSVLWSLGKKTKNHLVKRTTKFHWFMHVLFPSLSTGELERVIVNTSATLETATVDALKRSLQSEVSSLSQLFRIAGH